MGQLVKNYRSTRTRTLKLKMSKKAFVIERYSFLIVSDEIKVLVNFRRPKIRQF